MHRWIIGIAALTASCGDAGTLMVGDEPAGTSADDAAPEYKVLHRLNNTEYARTIADLLPVDFAVTDAFPPDPVANSGFDNEAATLTVSPLHVELYESTADDVLDEVFTIEDETLEERVIQAEGPGTTYVGGAQMGDFRYGFSAAGSVSMIMPIDADGIYEVEISAYARQYGDEIAQMRVLLDGRELDRFDVEATSEALGNYPLEIDLEEEIVELTVEFANPEESGTRALVLDWVSIRGPLDPEFGASLAYQQLVAWCDPLESSEDACASDVVERFASTAWRRPVTSDELAWLLDGYTRTREAGLSYDDGIRLSFKLALLAPQFLFRFEADPVDSDVRRLDGFELATRLSYFVWSSTPDAALLDAAENGTLLDPTILEWHARRMLLDARADALVENFAAQWLAVRSLDYAFPDAETFPDFDDDLRASMAAELQMLIGDHLLGGLPLDGIVTSNTAVVDARLAELYGLPFDPDGDEWQEVYLDNTARRGLLTTAGFLTGHSHPLTPSTVDRGKFVLENLLCTDVPPPPPNVEGATVELEEEVSVRAEEEILRLTEGTTCVGCHAAMDPYGHAMGAYDAVGEFRSVDERGFPIDTRVTLPDGTDVTSILDATEVIVTDPRYASCVVEKTYSYALGRDLGLADQPALEASTDALVASGMSFEELVVSVVLSDPFLTRGGTAPEPEGLTETAE